MIYMLIYLYILSGGSDDSVEELRRLLCQAEHENQQLQARVEIVEPLGPETHVHFQWAAQQVTARVSSELSVRPGDVLRLSLEPRHVHLFDAAGATL